MGFGVKLVSVPEAYAQLISHIRSSHPPQRSPRKLAACLPTNVPVVVEAGAIWDEGEMHGISLSGARIERTRVPMSVGSQVRITFELEDRGFEVVCRVAHGTDSGGYAVEFEAIDSRLRACVEKVSRAMNRLPDGG